MLDKVTTMPRSTLGERIGAGTDTTMTEVSRAPVVFLGVA
ncbi:hypothetical protein BH23ACT6_BH23ACT6_08070 [soil metagenome]